MNSSDERNARATRRGFIGSAAGLMAITGPAASALARPHPDTIAATDTVRPGRHGVEPFWGPHQGGIVTPAQAHTYFAAFDLTTPKREDVAALLREWTLAAARMTAGQTAAPIDDVADASAPDSADVLDLPPSRLTLTFGFGAGLFVKDGKDRYGLAAQRPEALVEMPKFISDQLIAERCGGDLSVQACADNPQVAFHAVRQLTRLAESVARIRWVQSGFVSVPDAKHTPRNLMGFKDGTGDPSVADSKAMDEFVWVGGEGPSWMRGGSYVVVRRSRIMLEHWDRMTVAFQEQTIGRRKISGAPLGRENEFDAVDLVSADKDGNPILPENSHVRLANPATNGGARILRRSYSYNDGVTFTAERWPPWHQGMEYDAGLLFVCYQRDPRSGFIGIFDRMSKFDMMNQFVTTNGSALFACPPGATRGEYIGQRLLEST